MYKTINDKKISVEFRLDILQVQVGWLLIILFLLRINLCSSQWHRDRSRQFLHPVVLRLQEGHRSRSFSFGRRSRFTFVVVRVLVNEVVAGFEGICRKFAFRWKVRVERGRLRLRFLPSPQIHLENESSTTRNSGISIQLQNKQVGPVCYYYFKEERKKRKTIKILMVVLYVSESGWSMTQGWTVSASSKLSQMIRAKLERRSSLNWLSVKALGTSPFSYQNRSPVFRCKTEEFELSCMLLGGC